MQVASGRREPAALPAPRGPGARVVQRAPALRRTRPADRRAGLELPRPWSGRGAARTQRHGAAAPPSASCRRCRCVAARREWGATIEERRSQTERALDLRGALRRLHRVRGGLRRRPPPGPRRPTLRRRTRGAARRPARHRLGPLRHRDPPAVGRAPRPGRDPRRRAPSGPSRTDRLRAQVLSPERQLAAFDLENTLIASNVVASYSWLATRRLGARTGRAWFALRTARRGTVDCWPRTGRTARTSCVRSTVATTAPPSTSSTRTHSEALLRGAARPVVPRRDPSGARAPRARTPHGAHHRRPRRRDRAVASAVRRRGLRRARPRRRRRRHRGADRPARDRAADRRGPRPDPRRALRNARARPSTRASPTRTRRRTCRCSRRSASPSRSTPNPGSPRSHAPAAGSSRTSARRPGSATRSFPSGHAGVTAQTRGVPR